METGLVRTNTWAQLGPALLDLHARPGRYALSRGEPRLVFEQSRLVLQLAAGRTVDGLAVDGATLEAMRAAARFFVRAGMLHKGQTITR